MPRPLDQYLCPRSLHVEAAWMRLTADHQDLRVTGAS
jgi:hypothetical protein